MVHLGLASNLLGNAPHAAYPLQRYPNGLGILHKEEVARHGARAKHELEGYDDALNQPTQPQTETTNNTSSSDINLASPSPRALELS